MRLRLDRREMLHAALGLAVLPLLGGRACARDAGEGGNAMGKDIVMIHGANEGGWCFDTFKTVFESLGWTCHAPDLIGHGTRAEDAAKILVGVGMADYRAELRTFLETLPPRPVLLGHSMGGVLAQQLAAEGLASALILVAPAPRSGILPPTDAEKQLDQDLMALGPIWKTVINPDFAMARIYTLNRVPEAEQRAVFDKFGPEFGPRLLRAVLLDVRPDRRHGGRHGRRALSGAVPGGRRGQDRLAANGAADGGSLSRQRRSGSSRDTATCSCSSPAPIRSPGASPTGSRVKRLR